MKFKKTIKKLLKSESTAHPGVTKIGDTKPLKTRLHENIQFIKENLGNSSDLIIREIRISKKNNIKLAIFYTDGLADTQSLNNFVLEPLMLEMRKMEFDQDIYSNPNVALQLMKDEVLTVSGITDVVDFDTLLTTILEGDIVILMDGSAWGLKVGMRGWEDRGVQEPSAQTVIRGPKEGFSESIRTNTALIRRRIKDPNLWLETKQIGERTKTDVALMFIKGIVNDKVLDEVHKRLDRINIDGILESGYIEELIQDETYTPFPTVYNTERPDAIAAGLLEGRIAILVDGTPFVLLVPALFGQFLQSSEDYYQRWDISNLIRLLRYIALAISLLGPSLYIAVTTFHQEMLPTPLLISLAAQREGVPFPAFVEALLMEVTFEILREAGVRMPRAIGQAVSIVGALVIGQAAVEAGIVSAAMVIVVAITAISSFVIPSFNMAISIRILRFGLMGFAASFGLLGVTLGLIAILLHMSSLRSFGVPYMSPFGPFNPSDQKDMIFRVPIGKMLTRPHLISQKNETRGQNEPASKPERE
ncbi:spore germination protein [Neobacillus kokaensis]|uniref:spore germination protein n=1 Tax=Neobacillus kokaensis TaxID=2759023 RepID=UPI00351AA617